MVLLVITCNILSALESLPESERVKLLLPAPQLNAPISHAQLVALRQNASSYSLKPGVEPGAASGTPYTLDFLLRGTKIYKHPPPPKPQPSPEYLAMKAKLEAEAEARKYHALLHPNSPEHHRPSPIFAASSAAVSAFDPNLDSDDPLTPSVAVNILVSVLFTGFAVYWALSHFRIPSFFTFSSSRTDTYPGAVSSQPFRVFVSLLAAIVVGVAEVVVYAAYLKKVAVAKEKERKKVEKKVVIHQVDTDVKCGDAGAAMSKKGSEKVEIWGKGVNGGARRRIRERWRERDEDE